MATGRVPTTANSPLTAKGDLFGYSTTQARVAVGNDGETLVADSSTSTGLRYRADYAAGKNAIINGDFFINQRQFTSTTTDGAYGFDRWVLASGGGCTYSAQTFTAGAAPVAGYEGVNFAQLLTTGQSGTTVYSILRQNIENVRTYAGNTVTVSFWAKAASGTPKIALEWTQNFGSGGSPSGEVDTYAGQATISTSWARYSITFAVPSISGKTVGTTANTSSNKVSFWVSAGSAYNARTGSIGIQSNTFQIWGVQAEIGSVATAFETATGTLQGELAACQRYYQRFDFDTDGLTGFFGNAYSTTAVALIRDLAVPLRTTQTTVDYSNFRLYDFVNGYTITSLVGWSSAENHTAAVLATGASGLTQYRVYYGANNGSAGYIAIGAEL
jgi:hypothetical protein